MDIDDPDVQAEEPAWVEFTEHGAAQANDGQLGPAEENWRQACDIAERLPEGDPRYAASLNNLAVIARLAQRVDEADRLYQQALQEWDQAYGWVERMQLAPRARSSLFHMRLESKHRDQFARWALDEYFKQLPRGAAVTLSNHAEWYRFTGKQARAQSLYRMALDQYEATLDAPADGTEVMRHNLAFSEAAESANDVVSTRRCVWAPALESSFIAQAEHEGWIIDRPPEFTDEGRFMAGLMCVYLIDHAEAAGL